MVIEKITSTILAKTKNLAYLCGKLKCYEKNIQSANND